MEVRTDHRLRRLRFRSAHRGCKELDIVFGRFAATWLGRLSDEQLGRYEALLDVEDPLVLAWLIGGDSPPPDHDNDVLALLLATARSA